MCQLCKKAWDVYLLARPCADSRSEQRIKRHSLAPSCPVSAASGKTMIFAPLALHLREKPTPMKASCSMPLMMTMMMMMMMMVVMMMMMILHNKSTADGDYA